MKNGNYILKKAPVEYPGTLYRNKYAYEHHIVWWENTGHTVPKGYDVHHKNENKHDNRFENLEIVSHKDHKSKKHPRKRTFVECTCSYCGKIFLRERRQLFYKKKRPQQRMFCCTDHMAMAYRLCSSTVER